MYYPSAAAHILGGLLGLIAAIIIYMNFRVLKRLDPYRMLVIVLLLSITVTVHGLSHLGLESKYGYNPMKYLS